MAAYAEGERASALEAAYRRGFIEGADKAVTGLRCRLTDDDLRMLRAWMRELSKWRIPAIDDPKTAPSFPQLPRSRPLDPRP